MGNGKRCVIIGGAQIGNYEAVRSSFREGDFYVFCDSGLRHLDALGVRPGLIVGDFDSYEDPRLEVETITLPRIKDDTDTVYAVKEMLRRGYEEFLLAGACGGRLDHTLGNVAILLYLDTLGRKACMIDDYSDMEIVSREKAYIEDRYAFFSLLNISGTAAGITVENAKYPLRDAEITCDYPYGVSNEVLPGRTASVSVGEGRLLLVKVKAEQKDVPTH